MKNMVKKGFLDNLRPASRAGLKSAEHKLLDRYNHILSRLDAIESFIPLNRVEGWGPLTSSEIQKCVLNCLNLFTPKAVVGYPKSRVGSPYDGGYIQVDNFAHIKGALSLGVSNDDNWDMKIASRGIPVQQYDYSIESAPTQDPLLHFRKLKIVAEPTEGAVTIPEILSQLDLPQSTALLKIDIEGDEWDVFDKIDLRSMQTFDQIVCEFHSLSRLREREFYDKVCRVAASIAKTHTSVHIHGNNYGRIANVANIPVPDVIEVTYANSASYQFADSDETFPTLIDTPNNPAYPDLYLGRFKF